MKKNVGSLDAILRILLGMSVLLVGLYFRSWWGWLGIIPLVTAWTGTCPVYSLSGISTCKKSA